MWTQDPQDISEELEWRSVLIRGLSCPVDSMSIASSDTLSTCPSSPDPEGPGFIPRPGFPKELAESILGRVIGKHLHQWVESSMTPRERFRLGSSFHPWFREFWDPIADLMLVSSTFHDIVSRLVRVAFGIQVPLVLGGINESLIHQVYNKLRSLFYFGSAVLCDAFQPPPATWEPLMNAYGNYIIMLKHRLWRSSPGLDMPEVREDLHMHLHLCYRQDLSIFLAEDLAHAVDQILEGR